MITVNPRAKLKKNWGLYHRSGSPLLRTGPTPKLGHPPGHIVSDVIKHATSREEYGGNVQHETKCNCDVLVSY